MDDDTQTPVQIIATLLIGSVLTVAGTYWISIWTLPVGVFATALVLALRNNGMRA